MRKQMSLLAVAALAALSAMGTEQISVDKVANHYPWDGKVDCTVTLSALESGATYQGAFTLSVTKNGSTLRRTVTNDFASGNGTYTKTFDCAELFGEGVYPNGGIAVALVKKGGGSGGDGSLGGVQLWENGPYWAECNVGASKPEEYGYYFWWGDTVGYYWDRINERWLSVKDGSSFSFNGSNCPTYGLDSLSLMSAGYVDSSGNLVAAHDAATVYLGAPWRMPTHAEIEALISNCTVKWITTNGVSGRLVTGKGAYVSKSIFLPVAGCGWESVFDDLGIEGDYWSSTLYSDDSNDAWDFCFDSDDVYGYDHDSRYDGFSVRPVRATSQ